MHSSYLLEEQYVAGRNGQATSKEGLACSLPGRLTSLEISSTQYYNFRARLLWLDCQEDLLGGGTGMIG